MTDFHHACSRLRRSLDLICGVANARSAFATPHKKFLPGARLMYFVAWKNARSAFFHATKYIVSAASPREHPVKEGKDTEHQPCSKMCCLQFAPHCKTNVSKYFAF